MSSGTPATVPRARLEAFLPGAFLVSLLLHALLFVAVTGGWALRARVTEKPPVYYVDLLQAPVANPQAGLPEPRVAAREQLTPPAPSAVQAPPSPLATPAKPLPPAKSAAAAKAAAQAEERELEKKMAQLQEAEEQRAYQERLARMIQRSTRQVLPAVPVGIPEGKGAEAGAPSLAYAQAFIQQNWALSPYLLADERQMAGIEAKVRLTYEKNGRLKSFRFEKESGDSRFDESVRRALAKSQQLPQPLPERLEDVLVTFNLKSMAESR